MGSRGRGANVGHQRRRLTPFRPAMRRAAAGSGGKPSLNCTGDLAIFQPELGVGSGLFASCLVWAGQRLKGLAAYGAAASPQRSWHCGGLAGHFSGRFGTTQDCEKCKSASLHWLPLALVSPAFSDATPYGRPEPWTAPRGLHMAGPAEAPGPTAHSSAVSSVVSIALPAACGCMSSQRELLWARKLECLH